MRNFTQSLILIFLLCFSVNSYALLDFEIGLGWAQSAIENEDGTSAKHSGIGLLARGTYLFYNENMFQMGFSLNGKYINTKNNSNSQELANDLSYGPGVDFKMGPLLLGVQYMFASPSYEFSSSTNNVEFDMDVISYNIGYKTELSPFNFLIVSYQGGFGKVPSEALGTNSDLNYSENTIWISFRMETQPGQKKKRPARSKYFFDGYRKPQ